jgi:hypothetical protein
MCQCLGSLHDFSSLLYVDFDQSYAKWLNGGYPLHVFVDQAMHADVLEWHFMLNQLQVFLEFGAQDSATRSPRSHTRQVGAMIWSSW